MNTTSTAQYPAVALSISCRRAVVIRAKNAGNNEVKTRRTPSITDDMPRVCSTLKYRIEIGVVKKVTAVVIVTPACIIRSRVLL